MENFLDTTNDSIFLIDPAHLYWARRCGTIEPGFCNNPVWCMCRNQAQSIIYSCLSIGWRFSEFMQLLSLSLSLGHAVWLLQPLSVHEGAADGRAAMWMKGPLRCRVWERRLLTVALPLFPARYVTRGLPALSLPLSFLYLLLSKPSQIQSQWYAFLCFPATRWTLFPGRPFGGVKRSAAHLIVTYWRRGAYFRKAKGKKKRAVNPFCIVAAGRNKSCRFTHSLPFFQLVKRANLNTRCVLACECLTVYALQYMLTAVNARCVCVSLSPLSGSWAPEPAFFPPVRRFVGGVLDRPQQRSAAASRPLCKRVRCVRGGVGTGAAPLCGT